MNWTIRFSDGAKFDLDEIQTYFAFEQSVSFAEQFIYEVLNKIESLQYSPERGHFPPELIDNYYKNVRETHYKSSRIFYELIENDIVILAIAHSRRDLRELLQRRMFRR